MKSDARSLLVSCGLALLGGCHSQADVVASCGIYDPAHPPQVLPISGIKATDPCLFRSGDTYWVFSTGTGIPVYRSTDHLATLQGQNPVFASNPSWIAPLLPQVTDLWSPDLSVFGNRIHLYYTASAFNIGKSCIGHATTPSLNQSFQDSGKPILCAGTGSTPDTFDAVDPAVVLDDLGNPWMVFGSWNDGIHVLALDQAGNRLDDQMTLVAARPASANALQAAFIYRGPEYFYLFVSFDSNPSHTLHVGRSQQVTGPYVDRAGTGLLQGGGTILLQSNDLYQGPGSNSVFDDNGCALNTYHVYDSSGASMLRIAPLVFDTDNWPVTAGP